MRAALAVLLLFAAASSSAGPIDRRAVDAARSGNSGAVVALIEQQVDVTIPEADGTTALHWAVRQDDFDLVKRLLAAGADATVANRYGITPLYLAAENGSTGTVEALLDAGASANEIGVEGETILMTAARTGVVDVARLLLARGAIVDQREGWLEQTALMWAAARGHADMMQELIAHGADVNARSSTQAWERQVTAEPREKWLPPGYLTPLMFAAREGCVVCIPILVKAGADIDATNPEGITSLIYGIINGHYDVAGALIDLGANPNLADVTGRTALYAAVDFNTMPHGSRPAPYVLDNTLTSTDVISRLIAHGADVNAQLIKMAPYRAKLDRGNDTMLNTGTTPFLRAAKAGDIVAMNLLLAHGADPGIATSQGINPLMAAAGLGTREEDSTGRLKTQPQALAAIEICMRAGLDVNALDKSGRTALFGAALRGFDQVVQYLADHGAQLDIKDQRGFTALDAALGKAGGYGFAGADGVVHDSTAALLRELIAAAPVAPAAPEQPLSQLP